MARPVTASIPTPECLGNKALAKANCWHPWGNSHLSMFLGSLGSSWRSTLHSNPELFCESLELFKISITGDYFRNTSQENACSKGFIKGKKKKKHASSLRARSCQFGRAICLQLDIINKPGSKRKPIIKVWIGLRWRNGTGTVIPELAWSHWRQPLLFQKTVQWCYDRLDLEWWRWPCSILVHIRSIIFSEY